MYSDSVKESVSIIGTDAFMEFVESIQTEGVELERQAMGIGTKPKAPLVIEVDKENVNKDIDALNIDIPILTRRAYREYKNLSDLDVTRFNFTPVTYQEFTEAEIQEIVFEYMTTSKIAHTTAVENPSVEDYRSALRYFVQTIMKEPLLISGYEVLYAKVKDFVQNRLFGKTVALNDSNTLRNLSQPSATITVIETFKRAINELTIQNKGDAQLSETIRIKDTRSFIVKDQDYLRPQKSVFNKITGDNQLELDFAAFLENCPDVVSYAKNYFGVHFKLDYVNTGGDITNYYPDFLVKLVDGRVIVAETKGREELDLPLKMQRLSQWCEDVNKATSDLNYNFVYVDQKNFNTYRLKTFQQLLDGFREYKTYTYD